MGGRLSCENHLDKDATFFCPQCDKHLCVGCTRHNWVGNGFVDQCAACDALLQDLSDRRVRADGARVGGLRIDASAAGFIERLPRMLAYPFERSVLITLAGLTALVAPLRWATEQPGNFYWFIGLALIWGLTTSMYFTMIQRTAHGDETLETPDFDNLYDDFFWPVVLIFFASLPLFLGIGWYGEERFNSWFLGLAVVAAPSDILSYPGPLLLTVVGLALLPLLTAIAALSSSLRAVTNPSLWIESLKIMASTYPVAAGAFYGVLLFDAFVYTPLLLEIAQEVDIPVVTRLVVTFLSFLPLALQARILGALCEPYLGNFDD